MEPRGIYDHFSVPNTLRQSSITERPAITSSAILSPHERRATKIENAPYVTSVSEKPAINTNIQNMACSFLCKGHRADDGGGG